MIVVWRGLLVVYIKENSGEMYRETVFRLRKFLSHINLAPLIALCYVILDSRGQ